MGISLLPHPTVALYVGLLFVIVLILAWYNFKKATVNFLYISSINNYRP